MRFNEVSVIDEYFMHYPCFQNFLTIVCDEQNAIPPELRTQLEDSFYALLSKIVQNKKDCEEEGSLHRYVSKIPCIHSLRRIPPPTTPKVANTTQLRSIPNVPNPPTQCEPVPMETSSNTTSPVKSSQMSLQYLAAPFLVSLEPSSEFDKDKCFRGLDGIWNVLENLAISLRITSACHQKQTLKLQYHNDEGKKMTENIELEKVFVKEFCFKSARGKLRTIIVSGSTGNETLTVKVSKASTFYKAKNKMTQMYPF